MKQILELKNKRSAKIEEMNSILNKASNEKREKTNKELTQWNDLKVQIERMNDELEVLETQERLNKMVAGSTASDVNEEREIKSYDLSKAIREFKNGGLTGFEKEIQSEGETEYKRFGQSTNGIVIPSKVMRAITKAGNASHIETSVNDVDFVADRGILSQLGVNIIEGLTSNVNMTYSDGFNAAFYAENATANETTPTEVDDKIEARRVQGFSGFSNEYLAQSAVMPQLMQDMMASIDTAVTKELLEAIIAANGTTLTGYTAATTGKVLNYKDLMKLKGAVKSSAFKNPRFVAGGELFADLESTSRDAGSGRFLIEDNKVGGYAATDVQGLLTADTSKYEMIFGDFARANVGFFSGLEILVDPYTLSNSGKTKLTYHRLADVSVNPNAFKVIKNANLS